MEREMAPPSAVVVPEVMIWVRLVHPDRQRGLSHMRLPFGQRIRGLCLRKQKATNLASGGGFVIREGFDFETQRASHIEQVTPLAHRGWLQQLGCYSPGSAGLFLMLISANQRSAQAASRNCVINNDRQSGV